MFALPEALTHPRDLPTAKSRHGSDSATLSYPIRASIATPASSLSRGDWGLKRPLPSKITSDKSSRPVVRVNEMDTFEHVTDFESASDHTRTLEKFQELNLPISLPNKVHYSSNIVPKHVSPFENHSDNTSLGEKNDPTSEEYDPAFRTYRHAGPWLGRMSNSEFNAYWKEVMRGRGELLSKLRNKLNAKLTAEKKKAARVSLRERLSAKLDELTEEEKTAAQGNGIDLENALNQDALKEYEVIEDKLSVRLDDEQFNRYIKSLRADPAALGPVIFEMLDLPTTPPLPSARMTAEYFESPPTRLSSPIYASTGPPSTHPSAGLSYLRTPIAMYNHPKFGPQASPRPVEARILRPRGKFRNQQGKALAGIAGIVAEDLNALSFADQTAPAGLSSFDASIPGGGKYYANPIRAFFKQDGRIVLSSFKATANSMAPYNIEEYRKPSGSSAGDIGLRGTRYVPSMDARSTRQQPSFMKSMNMDEVEQQPRQDTDSLARSLMRTIRAE